MRFRFAGADADIVHVFAESVLVQAGIRAVPDLVGHAREVLDGDFRVARGDRDRFIERVPCRALDGRACVSARANAGAYCGEHLREIRQEYVAFEVPEDIERDHGRLAGNDIGVQEVEEVEDGVNLACLYGCAFHLRAG